MKRILSLVLVLVLALSALAGCGNQDKGNTEKTYTLATGVAVTENLASSKLSQTVASIVTDEAGKIVLARLDCAEYTAYKNGELVTAAPTSKVALGDAYGAGSMPAGSFAKQAAALEAAVVGKTQSEVAALANDTGYAKDTDLFASCSINIADLIKAIGNAFNSKHKVTFKSTETSFTAGLSVVGSVKINEKEATDTAPASTNVKYSATFSTAVMADGKVVAAILDTAEPELVGVTADGSDSLSYAGSKRAQGDAYDSYSPMPAGRWYAQADAYAASAIGKSAANIATLAAEGVAGCTIYAGDYKAGLEAAVKAAR
ncbi:MAG: hypothetical protein IKB35_03815 [Clostridia bacterium]|nr:hypothetical protein [Clostridia bacterium]